MGIADAIRRYFWVEPPAIPPEDAARERYLLGRKQRYLTNDFPIGMLSDEVLITPQQRAQDVALQKLYAARRKAELEDARLKEADARFKDRLKGTKAFADKYGVEVMGDMVSRLSGAWGAYHPLLNSVYLSPDIGEGHRMEVLAHENEHKRQFNSPGDYASPDAVRISSSIADKLNMWEHLHPDIYNKTFKMPFEVMAYLRQGAVSSKDAGGQWPPRGWENLTNEEKLWVESNLNRAFTDQNYLQRGKWGEPIQRMKHLLDPIIEYPSNLIGRITK